MELGETYLTFLCSNWLGIHIKACTFDFDLQSLDIWFSALKEQSLPLPLSWIWQELVLQRKIQQQKQKFENVKLPYIYRWKTKSIIMAIPLLGLESAVCCIIFTPAFILKASKTISYVNKYQSIKYLIIKENYILIIHIEIGYHEHVGKWVPTYLI